MPDASQLAAPQRQWRAVASLFLPVGTSVAPSFLALGDVPLCAFKHLTGMPCPLCGGVRTCAALAQGDLAGALAINAGLLPLLAVAALHSGLLLAEAICGRQLAPPAALSLVWKLVGGVLLLSWLMRLSGSA
jgi:hypothetical protein